VKGSKYCNYAMIIHCLLKCFNCER